MKNKKTKHSQKKLKRGAVRQLLCLPSSAKEANFNAGELSDSLTSRGCWNCKHYDENKRKSFPCTVCFRASESEVDYWEAICR